jgi:nucleoid-associated protein YgaU
MALNNLTILVELPSGKLQFDEKNAEYCIVAMFNPNRLTISRTVQWESTKAAKRDSPELQFTNGEPSTLNVDLFFDTYDTPFLIKQNVLDYTNKLHSLTTVENHGGKHRPPVCRLKWWGGPFFQGVLQQMEQQLTMFTEGGAPVRATVKCTFKEWRTNQEDLKKENLLSADVAKVWVVKHGETLAGIAAYEYQDPRKWREIASANDISDPLKIHAGTNLILPALTSF